MKQHITMDQALNLSTKGADDLYKWSTSRGYNLTLNIGQMIEFLADNTDGIYSYPVMEDDDGTKYLQPAWINGIKIEEMCDDLWEDCKKVLNG